MSEANGATQSCDLGDGTMTFKAKVLKDGQPALAVFQLDIIEANEALDEIYRRYEKIKDDPATPPNAWLKEAASWLKSTVNVDLRLGQVDDLWQALREEFLKKKEQQRRRLDSLQSLLPSIPESTLEASALLND